MKTTPTPPPHVRDWTVRIALFEEGDKTLARAVLDSTSTTPLEATGHSVRGSDDDPVPEIGDEVAVARALHRLANRLLDVATDDIAQMTGEHDVTLRPN
jgi:hypothetical protein